MAEFTFELRGDPVANQRHRDARVWTREGMRTNRYTPKKTTDYRTRVLLAARQASGFPGSPWDGPIGIRVDAYFARPEGLLKTTSPRDAILMTSKPDFDNLAKGIMDALSPRRLKKRTGFEAIDAEIRRERVIGHPWFDDDQVHCEGAWRWYAALGAAPGIVVRIRRLRHDGQPLLLQEA